MYLKALIFFFFLESLSFSLMVFEKTKIKNTKNTFFDYVFYFITIQILRIIDIRKKNNNNPLSIFFSDWMDENLNYNILSN